MSKLWNTRTEHLKVPPLVLSIVKDFYSESKRLLMYKGETLGKWETPQRGLLQGCPFSPLLAAVFMRVWSAFTSVDHVSTFSFVDDRLMHASSSYIESLREATCRSRRFDAACGFVCRPSKCAVAALPSEEALMLAHELNYQCSPSLCILGLRHTVGQRGAINFDKDIELKIQCRATCISALPLPVFQRKLLLKQLVIPIFGWATGVVAHNENSLKTMRNAFLHAVQGAQLKDLPKVVALEVLGWELDPVASSFMQALQSGFRCALRNPRWIEQIPLDVAMQPWHQFMPALSFVLKQLKWTVAPDGQSLVRVDTCGRCRRFMIGKDNPAILKDWICSHMRERELRQCGRVQTSYHREEELTLAQGLNLPAPAPLLQCFFAGHKKQWHKATTKWMRHASLAVGCSVWNSFPRQKLSRDNEAAKCMCGKLFPSRAHLMWNCEHTLSFRVGLQPPLNRAEERLLACPLPEYPPPPSVLDYEGLAEQIADVIRQRSDGGNTLFLATDGSAKCGVATCSVVIPDLHAVFASGIPGEDQSSFRAEVEGILNALKGVALSLDPKLLSFRKVVLVCDCTSAIHLARGAHGDVPRLAQKLHCAVRELHSIGVTVEFMWVPSHGKTSPLFCGHPDVHEHQARAWNAQADRAAKSALATRLTGSEREQWHVAADRASSWEARAIAAMALIAERYEHFTSALKWPCERPGL